MLFPPFSQLWCCCRRRRRCWWLHHYDKERSRNYVRDEWFVWSHDTEECNSPWQWRHGGQSISGLVVGTRVGNLFTWLTPGEKSWTRNENNNQRPFLSELNLLISLHILKVLQPLKHSPTSWCTRCSNGGVLLLMKFIAILFLVFLSHSSRSMNFIFPQAQ